MSFFDLIGRWCGIAVIVVTLALAGLVGNILPMELSFLFGALIGISGGLIALAIGRIKYDK